MGDCHLNLRYRREGKGRIHSQCLLECHNFIWSGAMNRSNVRLRFSDILAVISCSGSAVVTVIERAYLPSSRLGWSSCNCKWHWKTLITLYWSRVLSKLDSTTKMQQQQQQQHHLYFLANIEPLATCIPSKSLSI